MFARLVRIQTKIERIDEAAKLFEDGVIPSCKDKKGYKGAYFLTDRKTGISILMTIWESEEDMLATESSRFFQEQLIKFRTFFKAPPIREAYEMVVQD
jgi:heme-degrading monooxygenase HmoA